jgi:hypothetical protein
MALRSRPSARQLRIPAAAVLLAAFVSIAGCANDRGEVPVASVHVFAADGVTCRDCGEAAPLEEMRQAIVAREGLEVVRWYGQHFEEVSHPGDVVMYVAPNGRFLEPGDYTLAAQVARLPVEGAWDLISTNLHDDEYRFRLDIGTLLYQRKVLWYWPDASKSYLTLHDVKGRKLWRRSVPFLDVPVWPVVTQRFALYVTGDVEGRLLAFVELDSGRAGKFRLPLGRGRIEPYFPVSVLPCVWDRFVVLQTCTTEYEDPVAGRGSRFVPSDIIVVELADGS